MANIMARSIPQIRLAFINSLVTTAAALGLTINPNNWISVPGSLSETDYKLLLLNMGVDAQSFEEQLNDLFQSQQEVLIASAAPQTGNWFQYQMLLFQFNATTPQVPLLQQSSAPNALSVVWNPVVLSYQVIKFCSVVYGSAGRCLIKVAAISAGIPADLDTIAGAGALAAATSFVNLIAAPGISYVVTSGISDWLFLQLVFQRLVVMLRMSGGDVGQRPHRHRILVSLPTPHLGSRRQRAEQRDGRLADALEFIQQVVDSARVRIRRARVIVFLETRSSVSSPREKRSAR